MLVAVDAVAVTVTISIVLRSLYLCLSQILTGEDHVLKRRPRPTLLSTVRGHRDDMMKNTDDDRAKDENLGGQRGRRRVRGPSVDEKKMKGHDSRPVTTSRSHEGVGEHEEARVLLQPPPNVTNVQQEEEEEEE